jgi:hypothetical protein
VRCPGNGHTHRTIRLAILDEATSAMSDTLAAACYALLRAEGIGYVSVSQQGAATLRPFHTTEVLFCPLRPLASLVLEYYCRAPLSRLSRY